jgi:hypothetical protein
MVQPRRFRIFLPISQVLLALFVGGWGVWLRVSILNHPFFGGTLWDSTARFHVWPWPLRFAIVLNLPTMAAGAVLAGLLDLIGLRRLPEWLSCLTMLPFVALLWNWIGSWMDRERSEGTGREATRRKWVVLFLFIAACAAASSVPSRVAGSISFISLGALLWLFAVLAVPRLPAFRRRGTNKHD